MIEGIAVIFFGLALVLGRWWRAAFALALIAVAFWIWAYASTDGSLYGDGRQDDGFWVIAGLASLIAVGLGAGIHQLARTLLKRRG